MYTHFFHLIILQFDLNTFSLRSLSNTRTSVLISPMLAAGPLKLICMFDFI